MNDDDLWIIVRNWDRFQSYEDTPEWIKLWLKLGSQPEFLHLALSLRGLLVTIWIEYARSEGVLEVGLARRLATSNPAEQRHLLANLRKLQEQGFIELSTAKPSRVRPRVRAREEKIREEARPPARTREGGGGRAQEQDHTPVSDRPQVNAPPSPVGAAAYVRNVGAQDPNLERTLRDTFHVPDELIADLVKGIP